MVDGFVFYSALLYHGRDDTSKIERRIPIRFQNRQAAAAVLIENNSSKPRAAVGNVEDAF